jgi:hypothetical protein
MKFTMKMNRLGKDFMYQFHQTFGLIGNDGGIFPVK